MCVTLISSIKRGKQEKKSISVCTSFTFFGKCILMLNKNVERHAQNVVKKTIAKKKL